MQCAYRRPHLYAIWRSCYTRIIFLFILKLNNIQCFNSFTLYTLVAHTKTFLQKIYLPLFFGLFWSKVAFHSNVLCETSQTCWRSFSHTRGRFYLVVGLKLPPTNEVYTTTYSSRKCYTSYKFRQLRSLDCWSSQLIKVFLVFVQYFHYYFGSRQTQRKSLCCLQTFLQPFKSDSLAKCYTDFIKPFFEVFSDCNLARR